MREFRAQGPCSCSAVSFNLGGGVFAQVSRGSRPECAGATGTVLRHNAATARTTRQLAARIRRARESERDRQTGSKIPHDAVALRAARTTGSAQKSAKTKSQSLCTSLCTSRPSQLNILKAQSLHPARVPTPSAASESFAARTKCGRADFWKRNVIVKAGIGTGFGEGFLHCTIWG